MTDTAQEHRDRVNRFKTMKHLLPKVLSGDDLEDMIEVVDEHIIKMIRKWHSDRINAILNILFPVYKKTYPEPDEPVRWPPTSWWWNGVTVQEINLVEHDGPSRYELRVQSYLGHDHFDSIEFVVPMEWVMIDNPKDFLHNVCREKKIEIERAELEKQRRFAEAELAHATAELKRLS